jgi:hypothetical protein
MGTISDVEKEKGWGVVRKANTKSECDQSVLYACMEMS